MQSEAETEIEVQTEGENSNRRPIYVTAKNYQPNQQVVVVVVGAGVAAAARLITNFLFIALDGSVAKRIEINQWQCQMACKK